MNKTNRTICTIKEFVEKNSDSKLLTTEYRFFSKNYLNVHLW